MRIHVNPIRLFLIPYGTLSENIFYFICIYIIQFDSLILYNLISLSSLFKKNESLPAFLQKKPYVNYIQITCSKLVAMAIQEE